MNLSDAISEVSKGGARWRLMFAAILVLFAAFYLYWSFARTSKPAAGVFTPAAPAVTASKVPGPRLSVPLKIIPKQALQRELPQIGPMPRDAEAVDTADIPPAENGVQTVTFLNLSTGEAHTVYTPKLAPWFALESRNTLGVGYQASTHGTHVPIYYRRDILRVKDLHLVGEVGGKIPVGPGRLEGHAAGFIEWRF